MRPAVPPSSLDPSFLSSLLNCFFAPLKATHVTNFARGGEWQHHRERVRWSNSSDGESDGIERVNKTFYRCRTSSLKHGGAEVHWSLLNIQHCQCNLRAATFSVKCADSCSLEQNHTVQMSQWRREDSVAEKESLLQEVIHSEKLNGAFRRAEAELP